MRLEVAAFEKLGRFAVINNSTDKVTSKVYDKNGKAQEITIEPAGLIWIEE